MKSFKYLAEIKEKEGNILEIDNFLNKKEISKLLSFHKKKYYIVDRNDEKKSAFSKNVRNPVRSVENWHQTIKSILLPKLKKLFTGVNFYVHPNEHPPHISESLYPIKVHADMGRNFNAIPFKQLLIPLHVPKKNIYTVFFKNRWYGLAANIRSSFHKKDPLEFKDIKGNFIKISYLDKFLDFLNINKTKKIVEFKKGYFKNTYVFRNYVKSLTKKKRYNTTTTKFYNSKKNFPKSIHKKYLTHQEYEDFKGLDFWKALEWKEGRLIVWDRSLVHSSSNFLNLKVKSKVGISIFFNRKLKK